MPVLSAELSSKNCQVIIKGKEIDYGMFRIKIIDHNNKTNDYCLTFRQSSASKLYFCKSMYTDMPLITFMSYSQDIGY